MSRLDDLAKEPWRFDFLDTLRYFERRNPHLPRIGDAAASDEEILKLGQDPYLEFPASNLAAFEHDERNRPYLFCRFLGLLGPQGALPLHTTVEAKLWKDARDDSFTRFLDIFNHRFLELFYRAWADARPIAHWDRPQPVLPRQHGKQKPIKGGDRFFAYVGAHIGLGTEPYRNRDSVSDLAKLSVAGLLAPAVKSASRLEYALAFLFDVHVRIEQFVGCWLRLERSDQSALAKAHSSLGRDIMIGASSFSVQDKIRIVMTVDSLSRFESFLPNGDFCEQLADIMYFYLGDLIDYDVQLALPARETKSVQLGKYGRLGWTGWMLPRQSGALSGMRSDCKFHPAERASRKRADLG